MSLRYFFVFFFGLTTVFPLLSIAQSDTEQTRSAARSLLHSLDYIAVDYQNAVQNGVVRNPGEYAEQQEFAAQLNIYLEHLPEHPQKANLAQNIAALQQAIAEKRSGETVAQLCRKSSHMLVTTYNVTVTPAVTPSLAQGERLYQRECTACHGLNGRGDGPLAHTLRPEPTDFHNRERQSRRSLYSLFSTLSLGVAGTAMPAFTWLNSTQRWALAFYVSQFSATEKQQQHGAALRQKSPNHDAIRDMKQLVLSTPEQIHTRSGEDGVAILAYLRAHPEQLAPRIKNPIGTSRQLLIASLQAYRDGEADKAYDLAMAAYLDGFELAEARLRTINPGLRKHIETSMADYRNALRAGQPAAIIAEKNTTILHQLRQAQKVMKKADSSPMVTLFSSMLILLREGLEAILVVAAIGAFLARADRLHHINYVHIGWISALLMGVATWFVTQQFITISGSHREITEGIAALFAAAMLLYVGFWLHRQSTARHWQQFLHSKLDQQIKKGALWGLVLVTFLAVYREVLETVLFYETFWLQSSAAGKPYIITGFIVAAALLFLVAWAIFRLSLRLPLRPFFLANMVLLIALSVIYTGKGIVALQEAGHISVDPINFPEIDLLGIYPTVETVGAQLMILILVLAWFTYQRIKNMHFIQTGSH